MTFRMAFVCLENTAVFFLPIHPRSPLIKCPLESNAHTLNGFAFDGVGQRSVLAGVAGELYAAVFRQIKAYCEVLNLKVISVYSARSLGAYFALDVQAIVEQLGAQCQSYGLLPTQGILCIVQPNVHCGCDL